MRSKPTPARRATHGALVLAALAAAAPAVAQETERVEERCECRARLGRAFAFAPFASRARLGVFLAEDGDEKVEGARIEEVVEEGPADRAGLRAGDVIVRVGESSVAPAEGGGASPAERVARALADAEPGDTVLVEYLRGAERRTASVATDAGGGPLVFRSLERIAPYVEAFPRGEIGEAVRVLRHPLAARSGLHLVDMNAGLEPYFGTREGALLVEAEEDPGLDLRAGDVILSVGGRAVEDAAHAHRILRSYRDGEAVEVEIIRQRKRQTLTGEIER